VVTNIRSSKDELTKQKDKKTQDLEALRQEVVKSEKDYKDEMDGKAGKRGGGKGEVADAKKALLDQNKATLEEGSGRLMPELNELQARIKAKELEMQIEEYEKSKKKICGILDPVTSMLTSFDNEEDLMHRIDDLYHELDTDGSGGLYSQKVSCIVII
jgi:chromosome segregation ATPase